MNENIWNCETYACYLKDETALLKSTSGGAFFAFAKNIIKKGGIVFGAAFQENFEVRHMSAETLEELEQLRKSKYVQSRIADTYKEAQSFLENGRIVLFSGTPCQIAGLKTFLGKDYDRLLTIDLICHGVPSHRLLKEHIEQLENTLGPLKEMYFRDKQNGWGNASVGYQLAEGEKKVVRCYEDAYFYGFDHYYTLRPSCYECQYRKMKSGADITIGDYWGIQKEHPDFTNDNKGISCVIIKSNKGSQLFQNCKDQFVYCHSTVRKVTNYNIWVVGTPGKKIGRKIFYEKWLRGEKKLSDIYQYIEKERKPVNMGIIGGYSSRAGVTVLRSYDPRVKLQWHITNSGICSMISDNNVDMDISNINVSNDYRYQSIENDIKKRLESKLSEKPSPQYIVVDFLEERFPLLFLKNNSVITESEAYGEIRDQVTIDLEKRMTIQELSMEYWKECCDRFIKILKKHYSPGQIILNRLYMVENHGQEGPEHPFENLQEIRCINKKLERYYDYFSANMPGIHVIDEIDPTSDFCIEGYLYGCEPVYYNRMTLCKIRDKMIEIMEDTSSWS